MKLDYKHLVEKPSLCGPACLSMIILRRGVWIDQELIAKEIGARILPKETEFFSLKLKVSEDAKDAGINLVEFDKKRVTDFLKKHKLKITPQVVHVSKIKNVKQFIMENLDKGSDLMANFHMGYFDKSKNWGHFNLIENIRGNRITFCDPWPTNKSFWETNVQELVFAMSDKFDGRERGFVVFS